MESFGCEKCPLIIHQFSKFKVQLLNSFQRSLISYIEPLFEKSFSFKTSPLRARSQLGSRPLSIRRARLAFKSEKLKVESQTQHENHRIDGFKIIFVFLCGHFEVPSVVFWGDPKAARGKRCLVSSYCWILVNLQKYTHTHRVLLHFPFSIWKTICANVVVVSWTRCILGEFQDLTFCRWWISKISPRTRSVLSLEIPEKTTRPCQILFGVFFVFVWWNTWLIFQEVIPKKKFM